MLSASLSNQQMTLPCSRYDFGGCWIDIGKGKSAATTRNATVKKKRLSIPPLASSATLDHSPNSSRSDFYKEVLASARDKFTMEISFQSKDKDISLAKALLYVAAEDEAFLAFNREMDARSIHHERKDTSSLLDAQGWDSVESMPMAGKNINGWLAELDTIANEVKAELVSREIGCDMGEVLDAVNKVLLEYRGLKRLPVLVDSKCSYLHSALSSGGASAILLSVIYIEVCQRLNLTIVGSRVGEDFLIWPPTGNPEELFKVISGPSLFAVVNGNCVDDPWSRASDVNSNSLLGLDVATNRDIIGITLANLIRLYWKRASRTNHGLMLTSPLRCLHNSEEKLNKKSCSSMPLLRPQELRFEMLNASMAGTCDSRLI
ncbi:uncharacterized protein LOC130987107 isoform X2 [Salvia miltiorrhiza]|uniref:uncharacterized protein LOC130987107 isoform X2 n=1 Tax=Salvia miltiorrhiza TaxID=226208 RepID=UPI0025ABA703|nr:uncharacterized protein LOC130987107 isoform X2 [Salvia miltiorrhiza]